MRSDEFRQRPQGRSNGFDVLCNNAGVMTGEDEATVDGCDTQMQTNHLSHFWLTAEVWTLLEKAASLRGEARVVNHSSLITCPSLSMRSRSSCEDEHCVTGDQFVAGFAHHVTAVAGAEFEAFNAYAVWCKDQTNDDGRQQETLDANIASTNAAIENASACSLYRTCRDCNS